jgi:GTPase SAR1 family protein
MVGSIFIVGTAGSGKSLLAASLAEFLRRENQRVAILNLDPGVLKTPYLPEIDIRRYVDIQTLMEDYGLGPNGGLVLAMDLGADYIEKMNQEIREFNPDYLIVDTSGQMELFAYRASGTFFASSLHGETRCILFLFDGVFCRDPRNFVSNTLLSSSIHLRFMEPVINVLTKTDLISREDLEREVSWSTKPRTLLDSLDAHFKGDEIVFLSRVARLIQSYLGRTWFIPVSAYTLDNVSNLLAAITRVLFGGEEKLEY